MKGKRFFGYKFLFFIALAAAIANAAARGYRPFFAFFVPGPDTTASDTSLTKNDSLRKLKFPIYDQTGDPMSDLKRPKSIDLEDPANVRKSFEYDSDSNRFEYQSHLGNEFLRNPTYLTLDEYLKYKATEEQNAYWQRRLEGLMLFNKTPELPPMYKEGLFDRIFGSSTIQVKPQGNVDVTFGGNWQNIKNPTLTQRAQKYGVFDFDMQMNINLLATVGDKLKLNISNNTKATFDYQNLQRIDYNGKEDEMLKKIEAGNVSFPLKSNLINGVQSLFGLKTQLQFGKLWVTAVVSQQKSQRKSLTIQGGTQAQQIAIKAYNYEENKNFLLAQYFRDNYDKAMKNFPVVNSHVIINRVEVWVTNKTGVVTGTRKALCFMDLGEGTPYKSQLSNPNSTVRFGLPDNSANVLYSLLQQNPAGRQQSSAINALDRLGLIQQEDYDYTTARQLSPSEFSFNPQLGYIMLNTQMNPDDIVGVAYRYTYKGKVYQVGEFASDLPPDTSNQKVLFLKLLKGTSPRTTLPVWKLMMKNIYALGGFGISRENFSLNIYYQDPGGGEKRYMPEGKYEGTPFITLLNLDRLNAQNEPQPDGVFDFVEGMTINTQQGKIVFPVLEPFGNGLRYAADNNLTLERKYIYQTLYDSTKFVAQQSQRNDRFIMRGTYKSSSSSEIFLGGFNIPPGSVSVSAGGTKLVENQDYQIEYGLGRIKILNTGILNSGVPINIQYEDNATFGFQQQNFMATRLDYYVNKNLTVGSTLMRLRERPFTQKVTFGEDPIQNTVIGFDANYQSEVPAITRAVDKLPIYSTTAPSFLNTNAEVAGILPGHPKQIDALDPEGSVYIDDFEGTSSNYDLKFPAQAWSLSSTPRGAINQFGQPILPEAALSNDLSNGKNRARLAWYTIEPTLIDPGVGGVPEYVKKDPNQHYIRMVQVQDVFPYRQNNQLQTALNTFDLGFYPKERGPYNFDATNIDPVTGELLNPTVRWGGITRSIDNTDFEASNVQYIQFWIMDPFIGRPAGYPGGSLYINLGNVSEDIMRDSRMFFENCIPSPFDPTKLDTTAWGYVPRFEQQITRAFDNDNAARTLQDVGYDGLSDDADPGRESEHTKFAKFLAQLKLKLGATNPAFLQVDADPANDNFRFYRDSSFNGPNSDQISVLTRYKRYNSPHGNSPITAANAAFTSMGTSIPESEDINRDNTLNESESYFQYRIDLKPDMRVGENYLVNIQNSIQPGGIKMPNGTTEPERWYQFKIPIQEYDHRIGGISDFRSIRFMRMFLNGWEDSVIIRFASLELGRNQWRNYRYSLTEPGENLPQKNQGLTDFTVTSVSIEENAYRDPVPYAIPPGVNRQVVANGTGGQSLQLNEQSLSLRACALQDGDARGVFKEVNVDMRQFTYLRMFIHAESMIGQIPINNGDVDAFIRIGSDFTNNYYEYRVPLTVSQRGITNTDAIWPAANQVNILLQDLVDAKRERDAKGIPDYLPYTTKDTKGNEIVVIGTPNIGGAKNIMLGLYNPKKTNQRLSDDGLAKCLEVWFDEMRLAGLSDRAGYAAAGKVSVQMADLGNVNVSGSMHTQGYGNIDQKILQRSQDDYYQYNTSTNLNMGKLVPRTWGVQLPLFVGYTENVSTPRYNPYDQDVLLKDALDVMNTVRKRDSLRSAAQDFTSITSFNLTNVRIQGNPAKAGKNKAPWSIKNFDFTYSYNRQFKHNPLIESDDLVTQRLGIGYTYSLKTRPIEPFKSSIKSKSKWLMLVKDFNVTPLPSTFSHRSDLNRIFQETNVRNLDEGTTFRLPPNFYKNFTWTRTYNLRWELMKSVALDYSAVNISRINEPYGRIDTKEKKDSLWRSVRSFGLNNSYSQTFNSSYNVPLAKLPLTDWMNLRLNYSATYSWLTAPPIAHDLGNTLGNTQTKTVAGDMNFGQLYNKSKLLRAINAKPASGKKDDKLAPSPGEKDGGLKKGKALPGAKLSDVNDEGKSVAAEPDGAKKDNARSGSKKTDSKSADNKTDTTETTASKSKLDNPAFAGINTENMTDAQLDSVIKAFKAADKAKAKEEKKKKKAARKAARKARRGKMPELTPAEQAIGQFVTMLNRATINYTETGGTVLPGYMDSTRFMGINNYSGAPGLDFVYGYQPGYEWLAMQAAAGRLSRDSLFNSQLQQTFSSNLNATASLQPAKDLRIDLNLTKAFAKSHNELYADTTYTGAGPFEHLNPYETGSFNITYISLYSMFRSSDVNSALYKQFLANRTVISQRLGRSNPYTNGLPDPTNPAYAKGYGPFSQDVLVPSFISAYSGTQSGTAPLIDYSHNRLRDNPFRYFTPMPNWKVTYNGLTKIPSFASVFSSFVVNHGYTGTMAMNSFNSSLLFGDLYGLGFPSFIDSNSQNYIPYFQAPNITITQAFTPLIGFDAAFKSNLTARFEVRKSKTQSLSLIDYQVGENISTEYVVGIGFRKKGVKVPFQAFGVRKLKNELIAKFDISIRDDKATNTFLANNVSVTSRGQKVIRVSPTIDYSINKNLTLRIFYDRQQTIPYVSNSFPSTTTRAGITLRFIFAQ